MKSVIFNFSLAAVFILVFGPALANNNTTKKATNTEFVVDFRSIHTWRGIVTSYSPTIEPWFEVRTNNTTTGIWFAQSIDGNYTELDLYFLYSYKNFTLGVYDYYCPPTFQASSEITNYSQNTTYHTIELTLAYKGPESFPVNFMVATMVYGDDLHSETNKNRYSSYFEISYSETIEENNIDLVLGINPFKSYYGEHFGVVNAGITASRNLKIFKQKEIPLQASLIANPLSNAFHLKFGFTL